MVGPSIGPYRILERLGAGGMGEVYLAEDPRLRRQVAIKTVSPERVDEPDARPRLLREARAAANLSHPNIAAIYDILESDGRAHIVMEYVRGETLAAILKRGPLAPARAVEIGLQLADALGAAHALGIVHRDLKPANVVMTPDAKAKVLDFGLAKRHVTDDSEALSSSDITASGFSVAGTPQYMSPEQLRGTSVDGRSDLYSFGVVLFEMLTGRRPYEGRDPGVLLTTLLSEPPPSARAVNPAVPVDLDAVARRAMARDPDARYASAAALRSDLAQATTSPSVISTFSASALLRSGPLARWDGKRYAIAGFILLVLGAGVRWLPQWTGLAQSSPAIPADAARWYEQGTAALREGSYLTAAKRLEQAVALHDAYPLAHARLAEARAELDDDRAKDSLLYVYRLVPDPSRLPKDDALYLEGIRSMVTRRFPDAVRAYSALAERFPRESHVHFDLGRAYEASDEPAKAIASYETAAELDVTAPAPSMRLGELLGQQQQLEASLAAFAKAESLYQAASNLEGLTEIACRRGALYNGLDRSKEARVELERALKLAAETENTHQRIRALLQLSGVAATEGASDEAERHASEAMDLARGMDSLSTSGLLDLGNVYFARGEYQRADRFFQEALATARNHKAPRTQARAQLSLGSLRISQGRPSDAIPLLEHALAFYEQGGFPRQTSLAYTLVGQVHDLRGEFQEAVKAFEGQLSAATQLKDEAAVAQAHLLLGLALLRWERLPQALEQLKAGEAIYRSLAHADLAYCLVNEGDALLRMGRVEAVRPILEELRLLATSQPGVPESLRARVDLLAARLAASKARFAQAARLTQSILANSATDETLRTEATTTLSLIKSKDGKSEEARRLANEAVVLSKKLGDPFVTVQALLALGTVELAASRVLPALQAASETLTESERRNLLLSAWQSSALAARAATAAGDRQQATSFEQRAHLFEVQLAASWGESETNSLLVGSKTHSPAARR